jgi:hypothetical protein
MSLHAVAGNASSNSTVDAIGAATVNITALELLNMTANSTAGAKAPEVADITGGIFSHCLKQVVVRNGIFSQIKCCIPRLVYTKP